MADEQEIIISATTSLLFYKIISKGYLFNQRISGEDLIDFKWEKKKRKG